MSGNYELCRKANPAKPDDMTLTPQCCDYLSGLVKDYYSKFDVMGRLWTSRPMSANFELCRKVNPAKPDDIYDLVRRLSVVITKDTHGYYVNIHI